jgi:hypothetical protein
MSWKLGFSEISIASTHFGCIQNFVLETSRKAVAVCIKEEAGRQH